MNLKKETLKGVKWTSLSSVVVSILQLIQLLILVHFLSSNDFGLMAISSAFIGLAQLFMDVGVSSAIIHKQTLTYRQLSSLYWLNILSGILISSIVYFSAGMVALYYGELQITSLLQLLASIFIISSFGNQYRTLYTKNLQFERLAKIEITSALFGFVVAVLCAINGFGVYSLIYSVLVMVSISNFLIILLGVSEYKPAFIYKHNEVNNLIRFGLFHMGEKTLNYLNSQFDVILIGKLLGTESLGIYSILKSLMMKPSKIINPTITKVLFPIMSTIQGDTVQLRRIYLKTVNYLCSINFFIYIGIIILAEPLNYIFFGNKDSEFVVIMQLLSFYYMLRSIANPAGVLILAKGKANLAFYWNLILTAFFPFFIYLGSFYGLSGVAIGLVILMTLIIFPHWFFIIKPLCEVDFIHYFKQIFQPFTACISAALLSYITLYFLSISVDSAYLFAVSYLLLYFMFYLFFTKIMNPLVYSDLLSYRSSQE